MQVNIPYGKEKIKVDIPDPCEVLAPNKVSVKDEDKLIEEALRNPIGADSFEKFVQNSDRLLVIVNDASKPTPTSSVLEYIYPILSNHPDVKFLVAVGTHKPPNEKECRFIFGRFYDIFKEQIFIHDSNFFFII